MYLCSDKAILLCGRALEPIIDPEMFSVRICMACYVQT